MYNIARRDTRHIQYLPKMTNKLKVFENTKQQITIKGFTKIINSRAN